MKGASVLVDDAAVTPRYVQGFRPERELPPIKRIAVASLRIKLLFILLFFRTVPVFDVSMTAPLTASTRRTPAWSACRRRCRTTCAARSCRCFIRRRERLPNEAANPCKHGEWSQPGSNR